MAKRNNGLKGALDRMTYDKPEFNKTLYQLKKSFGEIQKLLEGKRKK